MKFSAVILAGGKSSRMGRDKAFLEVDGQPLLARQIQLVRDVGADEIFISGRADMDYSTFNCPMLADRFTDAGPLAGIEAALAAGTSPLLLVLAVDMPGMSVGLLRQLATHSTESAGVIPRVNGNIEPLAALYPKLSAGLVTELLDTHFPLTPALSPREMEQRSRVSRHSNERPAAPVAGIQAGRRTILPLPEGEGRGEGERIVKSPSVRHFAERCVAAGLATFVDFPATDAPRFANWNSTADLPCLK